MNTKIIAELCSNHMGDINNAKKMIDYLAAIPKSRRPYIIKFQKRTPKLVLTQKEYQAPHPNPKNAFGKTYGEHKEFLEFSVDEHRILKEYCEQKGILYSSSVFDMQSAKDIISLKPSVIKISSANNNDYNLLEFIDKYNFSEFHVSLGMTTRDEEEKIFETIKNNRKNLIFYACTSSYPTKAEDSCLLEITRLQKQYGKYIKSVGFSGHHIGNVQDIAAVTLGVEYIERHFTLDKNLKGTDQAYSLDINDFEELTMAIETAEKSLAYKKQNILQSEQDVRNRLKYKGNIK